MANRKSKITDNGIRGIFPSVQTAKLEKVEEVNHPKHYNSHPSGIECHVIAGPFGYYLGNAVKYIWRCGLKGNGKEIQDLEKAIWYIQQEIINRAAAQSTSHDKPRP